MATEEGANSPPGTGTERDPAADPRTDYDYVSEEVERPDLVAALNRRLDGEVRFDTYTRQMYATDASAYEVTPIGVVFPRHTGDVAEAVEYCSDHGVPVLPRGGGTSLAGQTVNEAVVLDFTQHMDGLVEFDAGERIARTQPGLRLGDLNGALADDGLKFAPDPAWGDKSVIGGAIGNNSTGSHSLKYGKTDAYIESCEVVLADGTVTEFGEVTIGELRERADGEGIEAAIASEVVRILDDEREAIREAYPNLKRNVSGYNLDRLVEEAGEPGMDTEGDDEAGRDHRVVNLARLLAGSEGTLAVVTEATVSLEPVPETKSVALLGYPDLVTAMEDVSPILEHEPSAVEVMDEVLLELARDTSEFGKLVEETVPEGTGAVLLVEFYAESDAEGRTKVARLLADRAPDVETIADPGEEVETRAPVGSTFAAEAHDDDERARFWKLRKSGNPILLSRTSDAKHISFIEDTAVPPENLPEYVRGFQEVLEENGTFASFYAHAGPGCLHVRPLVNTKTVEGVEQMEAIADGATDLVAELGGSVSGEHGDGRARTQWNRKLYGDHVFELFRDLKRAYDPQGILNPGQVCGDISMTEHLRFDPDYEFETGFEPALNWENDNGMQGMVELCHGCGGCRGPQHTTGGVMCPTYRAAEEEVQSTRGRANMLRQAMSGDLPDDPTDPEFLSEVMDLCIGCKGCANDCPSEVDMAKLKAEVTHAAHERSGASLRDRVFANVHLLSDVGSALAPVSNWVQDLPGSGWLAEKTLGIAEERDLPAFRRETFADWFEARGPQVSEREATRKVVLFPDTYNDHTTPEVAKAAVEVLEAAGVRVDVPDTGPSGRAAHSMGFLDTARDRAERVVEDLLPRVQEGWDVVVVEPSDAVMFQKDYLDLLSGTDVETFSEYAYGVCEYLDRHGLDAEVEWSSSLESLTYHGHCHQKATKKDHHAVGVLRRAGYEVDPLDSTCCGMAGSFGYEAEHYSMSKAVASLLYDQVDESPGDVVVAPGASCRTQLGDRDGRSEKPPHPVEKLAEALPR
ncbi:FAD-binding and (Fe-S)-binding domain-containing protein [Salinirubellus sp. GCM10025818]|uniref:FAD-binding and (Fe-S)-binding domain-containing protein n=1 Tax=Salinirubellus TaxID=2162630 RepID=UPI0030D59E7C